MTPTLLRNNFHGGRNCHIEIENVVTYLHQTIDYDDLGFSVTPCEDIY